ncbi:hypothetical protein ACSYDW_03280 [Paeniglutamicibacter sp. R2-26]|uniref:hypothetical protein n=1 Tax=Paeniglutamicibacter sp. R2-26 TaxID=3144417 RepID=UPI003EE5B828
MEQQQGPRPRKSRRYTAPPQTVSDSVLLGVFDLPHGAGRPDPAGAQAGGISDAEGAGTGAGTGTGRDTNADTDADADAQAAPGRAATQAGHRGTRDADPVLPERAAEDDPRRWGDAEEDLGEWMKSQRPPHWD